jgi:hypothetical protein
MLIILFRIFILSIAAFKLDKKTESKALAILNEAIQIWLFKWFAILMVDDIIARGSIVL